MFAETHIVVRLEVSFSSLIEGFGIVFILLGCAFSMMIIMSAQLETQILYLLMALVFGMFAILPELFGHLPIEKAGYGTGVDEFDKLVKVNRAIIPIFLLSFTLLGNIIFGQFLERMNFTTLFLWIFSISFFMLGSVLTRFYFKKHTSENRSQMASDE